MSVFPSLVSVYSCTSAGVLFMIIIIPRNSHYGYCGNDKLRIETETESLRGLETRGGGVTVIQWSPRRSQGHYWIILIQTARVSNHVGMRSRHLEKAAS